MEHRPFIPPGPEPPCAGAKGGEPGNNQNCGYYSSSHDLSSDDCGRADECIRAFVQGGRAFCRCPNLPVESLQYQYHRTKKLIKSPARRSGQGDWLVLKARLLTKPSKSMTHFRQFLPARGILSGPFLAAGCNYREAPATTRICRSNISIRQYRSSVASGAVPSVASGTIVACEMKGGPALRCAYPLSVVSLISCQAGLWPVRTDDEE